MIGAMLTTTPNDPDGGQLPTLVLVTGAPGSGKTTLAMPLARHLGLPLITKDTIKEALFDTLGTGDHTWSQRLVDPQQIVLVIARRGPDDAGTSTRPSRDEDHLAAGPPWRLAHLVNNVARDTQRSGHRARGGQRAPR